MVLLFFPMQTIAVILAGGSGLRMNPDLPKQFMTIAGKPVIQYSIEAFLSPDLIDKLIIVCHPDYFDLIPEIPLGKGVEVHQIAGGNSRNDSTENALRLIRELLPDEDAVLMIHDAARPNVSQNTLKSLIGKMKSTRTVVPVSGLKDTIYSLDKQGNFDGLMDRDKLVKAHTPQVFQLSVLEKAYQMRSQSGKTEFTDDVSIVHHFLPQLEIVFVEDDPWNIKLTVPRDLMLMESLLSEER